MKTRSTTNVLTKIDTGKYLLQFGTELSPNPLPANKTQLPQNGTFSGVFVQNLGGEILGAGLVRYFRVDDFSVELDTFLIGSPFQDGLLVDHSVVIVVVP